MNLVYLSFASIYLLCPVEAVAENGLLQSTSPATTPTCGVTSIPSLACTIVEAFIAFVGVMCTVFGVMIDATDLIACVVGLLPPPLGSLFQLVINTITKGALMTTGACPITLGYWTGSVHSNCPGTFDALNDFLTGNLLNT